jgi:hypothetical protein
MRGRAQAGCWLRWNSVGRDGVVGHRQRVQQVRVLHPRPHQRLLRRRGELGVERGVAALFAVVVLGEHDLARARADVAQEHRLAPARVRIDQVRRETAVHHLLQRRGRGLAAHELGVQLAQLRVGAAHPVAGPVGLDQQVLHAGQHDLGLVHAHRPDLVPLGSQRGCDVAELAGEVLVDEQEFHGGPTIARPANRVRRMAQVLHAEGTRRSEHRTNSPWPLATPIQCR